MNYQDKFNQFINTESPVTAKLEAGLIGSHVNEDDAFAFLGELEKVYSNLDEAKESIYAASGLAGSPGYSSGGFHGIDFFDAQITAEIKSYTGIFSVERSQEQPNASIAYFNLYGVKTGNLITPNLGVSRTFNEGEGDYQFEIMDTTANIVTAKSFATIAAGDFKLNAIPVVPGSIRISIQEVDGPVAGKIHSITDSGTGYFLGEPGLITANTIDYGHAGNVPAFGFTLEAGKFQATNLLMSVEYVEDTPKVQNDRIKAEIEYYQSTTAPVQVPYEVNQVTAAAAKKSLGLDLREYTLDSVTSEYTKIMNKKVDIAIQRSATRKDENIIDLSSYSVAAGEHRSLADSFLVQLGGLDTTLSKKAEKANEITAYLVSLSASDIFRVLDGLSPKWVPNKGTSYVNDIIGYLDGVPVVRSKYVKDALAGQILQGYAVHKHQTGKLAPLMRGMYLPLTTMNEVGDFNNPLIKTGGVFSYEGVDVLTSDLTIGFQIKVTPGSGVIVNRG